MPLSSEILDLLAAGTGYFVTLVRVKATTSHGGETIGVALHTNNVTFEGTTYEAMPFEVSKLSSTAGVQVDNATITHLLNEIFSKKTILGRKWAGAEITLISVDPRHLAAGAARKHIGRLGEVTMVGGQATSEFRGLIQLLQQEIGDRTSKRCRYDLGDGNCTVDLNNFTESGTVGEVINQQKLVVSISHANSYFKYGQIRFTSGENDGLEMEILDNVGETITLFQTLRGTIEVGDSIALVAGDDKSLQTCHSKFANAVNFGAEPNSPNKEDLFRFPD